MTNRPLDREETEALKKIRSGLRHARADWLGGLMMYRDASRNVDAMLQSGTNDGEDVVEELTDEDAKQRPWVMCRDEDDQDWRGPYKLIAVKEMNLKNVVIRTTSSGADVITAYKFARPLTTEEKARYSK